MKTQTTTAKQKVIIPATPEEVYEAYTNPKVHSEFTGNKAIGTAKVGEKSTAYDIAGNIRKKICRRMDRILLESPKGALQQESKEKVKILPPTRSPARSTSTTLCIPI